MVKGEGGELRRASSACTVATIAPEPEVQEGDSSGPSGFPRMADMHTGTRIKSPGLEIRLKEILVAIVYSRGCPYLISRYGYYLSSVLLAGNWQVHLQYGCSVR